MTQKSIERFQALTQLLRGTDCYWREAAFYSQRPAWLQLQPELERRLLALAHADIIRLEGDPAGLIELLNPYLPFARELQDLAQLPALPQAPRASMPPRFYAGMPGRKWQQVEAFGGCVTVTSPVLEWCAGKSYLGFYLQHLSDQPLTALEWDPALVAAANARARASGAALRSCQVDVLSEAAAPYLDASTAVVALHACGELHERLLRLSVRQQVPALHLAPCCYHKRTDARYQPLSRLGQVADLPLNKTELHLAVMETATAGASLRRQRQRLQAMRLGFDQLQRDLRGAADYLPVPSLPGHWARADFASFCQHCAALTQLSLPARLDWDRYQKSGESRFWQVAALDLVRFLFRRPLEVWLALDRALLLYEQGYDIRLGSFCAASITPRNLLLQAWRR